MNKYLALGVLGLGALAYAQEPKLSVFDTLKDKASENTIVNLPKNLIDVGASFLDDADLKKLTGGLRNVQVRSLEFDKEGVYTDADVKQLISELAGPGWNLIISVDEKKEKSRIWIKAANGGEVGGLRILSAEPRELTVVVIDGKVRPEDLKKLGALGVPDILSEHGQSSKKKEE